MIFQVLKPVDVDIKYLDVYCGGRVYAEDIQLSNNKDYETMEEIWEDFPSLKGTIDNYNELYLRIDIETGKIVNWPANISANFNDIKVVDEGTYILLDSECNEIHRYCGYVPECLSIESDGYGDYFEFDITNGVIDDWNISQEHIDELLEIKNND